MTFKELQKVIESQPNSQQNQLHRLKNKEFWFWFERRHKDVDRITKGDCCMQHIIGLPKKDGKEFPLFEYERLLYRALVEPGYLNNYPGSGSRKIDPSSTTLNHNNIWYPFKEKHLWIKKATGIGVTEFMLRFMAWLCVRNDDCQNSQMVIVTGPNIDLAIKLIKRMKGLFAAKLGFTTDSKETVLELNGCNIQAFPSNHIDSFRSLTNPKFILVDEGDYLPKFQQDDVRAVSERYIAKSDPFIVMVSTPNAPGGLFQKIEQEPFETCLYKKIFLDYTYGLGFIYTKEEIDKAKLSPSFPREYELQYLGLIGNVFSTQSIENAKSTSYTPGVFKQNVKTSVGVDAGFGSSKFGIVVTQLFDNRIHVMFADEFERPNFSEMINRIWQLKQKCGHVSNIFCDSANPEIIEALKREFGESTNWQYIHDQILECKKHNMYVEDRMMVVPVPFSVEGRKMLEHSKYLLDETDEEGKALIAIHPSLENLITALRTAVANENKLSKEETSINDTLDAFMLSLQFYKRTKG